MPSILTITDPHIRIGKPEGRRETDWLEVCMGQMSQAFAVAEQYECEAIVCSGDLGDSPNWTPRAMRRFIDLCGRYPKIKFITTLGQHDVYGHNIDTWENTSVGILEATGVITILRNGHYELIGDDLAVYGFAFGEDETKELLSGKWTPPEAHKPRFKVALVHASVGSSETMGWDSIENQNVRNVDLASFGDIHQGFDPYTHKSGAISFSTGSLTRSSRADVGRVPLVGIITVSSEWGLEFEQVYDGHDEDVFILDNASEALADTAERFKQLLSTALDFRDETPHKRVQRVGTEHKYTPKQISLVLSKLETGDE